MIAENSPINQSRKPRLVGGLDESIVERPITVPDLYATASKVLGFDPDREFIVHKRPTTLVDPEGKILRDILA